MDLIRHFSLYIRGPTHSFTSFSAKPISLAFLVFVCGRPSCFEFLLASACGRLSSPSTVSNQVFVLIFSFMSYRSKVSPSDLESLPSWVSDHLGEGSSYITDEVRQSPRSPMEDPSAPEVAPLGEVHPSVGKEHNIMTPEELDLLRETYSFPQGVQLRLPE